MQKVWSMGVLVTVVSMGAGTGAALSESARFDGTYSLDPGSSGCVVGQGDVPGAAFRIEGGVFTGVAATCEMRNPTNIRDMDAVLFDFHCEGEGTSWRDRVMLMRMDDGSLLRVVDGLAFTDPPCRD